MTTPLIIAIDGPAASGKGTVAKRLAAHYGLRYLDTGCLYRAVAMRVIAHGGEPTDAHAATQAARDITPADIDNPALRSEHIGQAASIVSAMPEVRAALLDYQRQVAAHGAVLDGRDIGTVICPEAPVKFFVTASFETRAQRRTQQLQASGVHADYATVLADIMARDKRDSLRSVAPLQAARDAITIDTSAMDAEQVFQTMLPVVEKKIENRN